jgi:predicted PurR-regulated permease PerM
MADTVPVDVHQEQTDVTTPPTEPLSDGPAPVAVPASSPTSSTLITNAQATVPGAPVLVYIQPAQGVDPLAPRTHPRATYPFGWSSVDLRRWLGLMFAAIIALLFLYLVQSILPPFIIAFAFAALFDPTLRYFERHGYSRVRSVLTLYLSGVALVGLFFVFIVPVVTRQVNEISGNIEGVSQQFQDGADSYMKSHTALLNRLNIKQRTLSELINQNSSPVRKAIGEVLGSVTAFLSSAASKALWLVIIPLATFFFMRDYPLMRARIIALFPESYHQPIDYMSREVVDVFSAYIRGLAKICGLYCIVASLLFCFLGLNYWLFLGLLAGVFYAVPYVGQLVTALGSGIVAYMMPTHRVLFFLQIEAHSIRYVLVVVIVAIIVQNVFDQILYPRLVGGSVGLHPVLSIFSLMAGATLFGVWGMLLAVPVAASLQLLLITFFPKLVQKPPASLLETPAPLA